MKISLALLALLPAIVFAGGSGDGHHSSPPPTPVDPSQQQGQLQAQGQQQGQAQGQGQGQSQDATADASANSSSQSSSGSSSSSVASGGNASNVGNTVSVSSIYKQVRQAPGASADAGNTTSQCFHDVRVGFSTPFGGVSFGKGRKSQDCFRLELAQYLYDRGNDIAGDRLMCAVTDVKQALGDDCLALVHELHAAPTTTSETKYVTQDELDRVVRKTLVK